MIYNGGFENAKDVFTNFNVSDADRKGVNILYAVYDNEDYQGSAGVIFFKEDKLYQVTGSHCSCYGLEDQWEPEEVEIDVMLGLNERGASPYGLDYGHFLKTLADIVGGDISGLNLKQVAMLARLIG